MPQWIKQTKNNTCRLLTLCNSTKHGKVKYILGQNWEQNVTFDQSFPFWCIPKITSTVSSKKSTSDVSRCLK